MNIMNMMNMMNMIIKNEMIMNMIMNIKSLISYDSCPEMLSEVIIPILANPNQQSQCVPSALLIAHHALAHASSSTVLQEFLLVASTWMMAPEGLNRTVSQVVVANLLEMHPEERKNPIFKQLHAMLTENKRISVMRKKQHAILTSHVPEMQLTVEYLLESSQNNLNDFSPSILLEEMQEVMETVLASWYREDYPQTSSSSSSSSSSSTAELSVEKKEDESEEENQDFQKKILPWTDVSKAEVEKRRKQSVIVVATYVDKL